MVWERYFKSGKFHTIKNLFREKVMLAKMIKNDSIIINTTPIGMQSAQSPIDFELIHKNQTLIDVIYTPFETAFLELGKKIGAKTLNGLDMFIYQGQKSFYLWNKINPEIDDGLIELLKSKLK